MLTVIDPEPSKVSDLIAYNAHDTEGVHLLRPIDRLCRPPLPRDQRHSLLQPLQTDAHHREG